MSFMADLRASHENSLLPYWEAHYRKYFPGLIYIHSCLHDGFYQKLGVDRVIDLEHARSIYIEEKADYHPHSENFAIEIWSNQQNSTPGCFIKPTLADYFAYSFPTAPGGPKVYMIPVREFQAAYAGGGREWHAKFKSFSCKTGAYTTTGLVIPRDFLLDEVAKVFYS
jgi:hypothetical protein